MTSVSAHCHGDKHVKLKNFFSLAADSLVGGVQVKVLSVWTEEMRSKRV